MSDDRRLLTGSGDLDILGEAKVWDATKGQDLLTLKSHKGSVTGVAFDPNSLRVLTGSFDGTAKVWDADKTQDVFYLKGHALPVTGIAFSPNGRIILASDEQKQVLAWDTKTGLSVDPVDPPPVPLPGLARSPDGFLEARPNDNMVEVIDSRLVNPKANHWPLPNRVERQRYHAEKAAQAEKEKQWFAAAFHLGRLLLDDPDNAELNRRREQALKEVSSK